MPPRKRDRLYVSLWVNYRWTGCTRIDNEASIYDENLELDMATKDTNPRSGARSRTIHTRCTDDKSKMDDPAFAPLRRDNVKNEVVISRGNIRYY